MTERLQAAILVILLEFGDEATMPDIRDRLASEGRTISFGALYTTLMRMNEKKLITRRKGAPRPVPGGRFRYFYKITDSGRTVIAQTVIELERAAAALGSRISVAKRPTSRRPRGKAARRIPN